MRKIVSAIALLALVGACASDPPPPPPPQQPVAAPRSNAIRVPSVTSSSGTHRVEVAIDGACCVPFLVDSGASDVSVSAELFRIMIQHGRVTKADLIDVVKYQTANGVAEGLRFRMPPLTVGGHTVYGVVGSVSEGSDMLLLGQSFLKKFRFWAIDNNSGELVLGI